MRIENATKGFQIDSDGKNRENIGREKAKTQIIKQSKNTKDNLILDFNDLILVHITGSIKSSGHQAPEQRKLNQAGAQECRDCKNRE